MSQSLTRVPRSSPDTVAALEQLLHHPRADEAAGAGHAHQLLLLTAVGLGRHGDPAQQVPMLKLLVECVWNGSVSVSDSQCVFVPRSLSLSATRRQMLSCVVILARMVWWQPVFIPRGGEPKRKRSWLGEAQLRPPSREAPGRLLLCSFSGGGRRVERSGQQQAALAGFRGVEAAW